MPNILAFFGRSISTLDRSQTSNPYRSQLYTIRSKLIIRSAQIALFTIACWQIIAPARADSLPPDNDIPEEVLRAEIITEARSPIDGKALSAVEFAELVVTTRQQIERDNAAVAANSPKLKETLFLLRLRGFLRSVGVPIK
jgi:hypothetical protein